MDRYVKIEKAFNPEYFEEGKVVIVDVKEDFSVNVTFEDSSGAPVVSKFIFRRNEGSCIGWVYKCSYNTLEVLIPKIKNGPLYEKCIFTLNAVDSDKFEIYRSDELCFTPKSSITTWSELKEYADENIVSIDPVVIIHDKYLGQFSGGLFHAWGCNPRDIPWDEYESPRTHIALWDKIKAGNYPILVGVGKTPNLAVKDLIDKKSKDYEEKHSLNDEGDDNNGKSDMDV